MTETWTKHTFVCDPDECDTLIEISTKDTFGFPSGYVHMKCPCGREMQLVSVGDATISPTNGRKDMETSTEYNANVLVTYKDITNGVVTYPTIKVNELEYKLERVKNLEDFLSRSQGTISKIMDELTEESWFNPNTEKEEILSQLCEILDYTPKKEISFTATMKFEGRIEIDLADAEDFDLEDLLSEAYVETYNGNVVIDNYELYDANEC